MTSFVVWSLIVCSVLILTLAVAVTVVVSVAGGLVLFAFFALIVIASVSARQAHCLH